MKQGLKLSTQLYALSGFIVIYAFVTSIINHSHTMRDYLDLPISLKTDNTTDAILNLISDDLSAKNYMSVMNKLDTFVSNQKVALVIIKDSTDNIIFEYMPAQNTASLELIPILGITAPIKPSYVTLNETPFSLFVQIDSTEFNATLWQYLIRTLTTTIILACIILLVVWRLIFTITRSLSSLEKQAIGISKKQFDENTISGFTLEFKTLSQAFNQMTQNIKRSFSEHTQSNEKLIKQAFVDSLTELPNRRAAQNYIEQFQKSYDKQSDTLWVFLVRLESLQIINDDQGYGGGDAYVKEVADSIKSTLLDLTDYRLFRLSGSEFLLCLNKQSVDHNYVAKELDATFKSKRQSIHKHEFAVFISHEVTPKMSFSDILCHADNSINQKCTTQIHQADKHQFVSSNKTKERWQQTLKNYEQSAEVLDLNSHNSKIFTYSVHEFLHRTHVLTAFINLHIQPIYSKNHEVLYNESFVRFIDGGQTLNTSEMFAAAERLNVAQTLERTIITYTIRNLISQVNTKQPKQPKQPRNRIRY